MGQDRVTHDIFISYRREGGFETARHLYDNLTRDGYGVTFDLDTLRSGRFDEALLQRIDECTDFIIVLNKGCFDRTLDPAFPCENDWMRRELGYAIEKQKNIIPILLADFQLPEDIAVVQRLNAPPYSREYFDSFYEKLKKFLKASTTIRRAPRGQEIEQLPIPSTVSMPSRVFVGRAGELEGLHHWLSAGRIPVVTGPGGTGKSELVFHYAAAYREEYPGGLFQIDMETAQGWDDALQRLLSVPSLDMKALLELDEKDKFGTDTPVPREIAGTDIIGGLRRRVERYGRILLVLDNIESAKAFLREPVLDRLSLPPEVAALATARTLDILFRPTDRAVEFPLSDLAPEAALELLLKDNPAKSDTERRAAKNIARLLDFRALHLRAVPALLDDPYSLHAGSYVSLEAALRDNLQKTVEDAMVDYGEGSRTPSALWTMTREALARHPMGREWLKLTHIAAFLSPEGFREYSLHYLWDKLVALHETPARAFDQALDVLQRHGLLDKSEEGFRMHRLTAAVLRETAQSVAVSAELLVNPLVDYARQLRKQLDFSESRRLFETALELYRHLAATHPETYETDVGCTLNDLANAHRSMQQLSEAEAEFGEALAIARKLATVHSNTHESDIAVTLNNLALLHSDTLRLEEAEAEYREALAIFRKLAVAHPEVYRIDVACSLGHLANLHRDTQRPVEAEAEYEEALSILRELAAKNPEAYESDVARTLNNLAALHSYTQRLSEAEAEYSEALDICRRIAEDGSNYLPDVARTLNNLALLHRETKRLTEAEVEYRNALEIYRNLVAESPEVFEPNIVTTLNNLANLHHAMQQFAEAEAEFVEALKISRILSAKNPDAYESDVAMVLNNLALLHSSTRRTLEAEKEYKEALDLYRSLAEKSPSAYERYVAEPLNNLANLHCDMKRLVEAEAEYAEAFKIRRRLATKNPEAYEPELAEVLCNWGALCEAKGDKEGATRLTQEALDIYMRCEKRVPGKYKEKIDEQRARLARMGEADA